ncbi:MAG: tRNA (adenosine(37)-N6)-dimethylallyltransferase MiaA [Candidatus Omnitrophica bacterium]|nr:tRNA (adenosine(37)-N6)-dimethylallyltransferase MiaA [Candidatus Omnitrophota bacterium]
MLPVKPQIIFLVGPTAVGKTEIALYLAKKLKAEIISCDSMQIYKGMDIIASKPSLGQLKTIPHYLISTIPSEKAYNVSQYRKDALKIIKEIVKRKKIPLFVGGTGLYMAILINGIFELDTQGSKIRKKLQKIALNKGSDYLHKELHKVDPEAAEKIHHHDAKRIIRALEVFKLTGKSITALQKLRHGLKDDYDIKIFCLDIKREELYKRIDERVDRMFKQGLVNEARRLLKKNLSKTAACAIGLNELKGYFAGIYGQDVAKHFMKRNSRRYAKRQLTWFRKDKSIQWVKIKEMDKPKEITKKILMKITSQTHQHIGRSELQFTLPFQGFRKLSAH